MSTVSATSPAQPNHSVKPNHNEAIAALHTRFGKQLSLNQTIR